jgi:ferritin-like protein
VVLSGCGKESLHTRLKRQPSVAQRDVQQLNHLLDVQHLAIAAYTAGTPLLADSAAAAAQQFLAQELGHAGGLAGLVKAAGGKPHEPLGSYNLGAPRTANDVLRLLQRIEQIELSSFLDALAQLGPGEVRAQVAGYFANDAQHDSAVRLLLGQDPLPSALVPGPK